MSYFLRDPFSRQIQQITYTLLDNQLDMWYYWFSGWMYLYSRYVFIYSEQFSQHIIIYKLRNNYVCSRYLLLMT